MPLYVTNPICLYFIIPGWINAVRSIVRPAYCSMLPTYFCIFLDLRFIICSYYFLTEMLIRVFPCNFLLRTAWNTRTKEESSEAVTDQILFRLVCNIFFVLFCSELKICVKIMNTPFDFCGLARFRFWRMKWEQLHHWFYFQDSFTEICYRCLIFTS